MTSAKYSPSNVQALASLIEMSNRIGYLYGGETIGMLFYSLIRRERPSNIVEFGTGLGVSTMWMAQAVKENGVGRVWSIDDGSDWANHDKLRAALKPLADTKPFDGLDHSTLEYADYINELAKVLEVEPQVTFINDHVDINNDGFMAGESCPFTAEPIDFLFLDMDRSPPAIMNFLRYLLPFTAECVSIFIDSASTSLASYAFLERLVDQLNRGKVPRRFLEGDATASRQRLCEIVAWRQFKLNHLVERVDRKQNSTAWLKCEPVDFIPHPATAMKLL